MIYQLFISSATIVKVDEMTECLNIASEPKNHVTCLTISSAMQDVMTKYKTGSPSFKLLDEPVFSVYFGTLIEKYSPYIEVLNEIVFGLMSGNILEYNENQFFKFRPKNTKFSSDEVGPQVLAMDHLDNCFLIITIFLTLAFIIFLIEVAVAPIRTLVDRILLFYIIKTYITCKQLP